MLNYFKLLGVLLFFTLQFIFILPYCMSSNQWWEFALGWFILLVIDPIVVYRLLKDSTNLVDELFKEKY